MSPTAAEIALHLLLLPNAISLARMADRFVPRPQRGWVYGLIAGVTINLVSFLVDGVTGRTNKDARE